MMIKKTPKKIKDVIWKTVRFLDMGSLILRFYPNSILRQDGWFRSFRKGIPVDGKGAPLPWYTYSFIHFCESRLSPQMRIFEYGCGNSTFWYSSRVKEVVSVDNNKYWADLVSQRVQDNCKILYQESENEYIHASVPHGPFDIVVIDGIYRDKCARPAVEALKENGVIIWDNSDRADFQETLPWLQQRGFREIPFYGIVPANFVSNRTSILYRDQNCFGI